MSTGIFSFFWRGGGGGGGWGEGGREEGLRMFRTLTVHYLYMFSLPIHFHYRSFSLPGTIKATRIWGKIAE